MTAPTDNSQQPPELKPLPWFKDLTQVKRFVHGRAHRSFAKSSPVMADEETKKIVEIFKG